jgi:DNA-binding transcriptional regulator of glucitol operon
MCSFYLFYLVIAICGLLECSWLKMSMFQGADVLLGSGALSWKRVDSSGPPGEYWGRRKDGERATGLWPFYLFYLVIAICGLLECSWLKMSMFQGADVLLAW